MKISNLAANISSQDHINHSVSVDNEAERIFSYKLPTSVKTGKALDINHVDFIWGDYNIDIKGHKKGVDSGYFLIEFINVRGDYGWASSKSFADYIAFQVKNNFIFLKKTDIIDLSLKKCGIFAFEHLFDIEDKVLRLPDMLNRFDFKDLEYRLLGRVGREDIFTYVPIEDFLSIKHFII